MENLVKTAVRQKSEMKIKGDFLSYSKLENHNTVAEGLEIKQYVKNMSLRNARTNFRIRSHMIPAKMNRKSDPKFASELWWCDDCLSLCGVQLMHP